MRLATLKLLCALSLMVLFSPKPVFAAPENAPRNMLLDNFESASMKNLLGGYIGSDIASPGTCRFSFTMAQQDTFGRAMHALKMEYDVRARGSFTYLWLHLGPEGQDGKIQTVDLNPHRYLSFWAKSGKRGENFKIELHCDTNGSGRYEPGEDASAQVYADRYVGRDGLKDTWRKIVIPLADFAAVKDRSRALEIVFVFENLRGNKQGTVIVDEILLGLQAIPNSRNALIMPTPVTQVPATATVQALPMLRAGFSHPLAARRSPSEFLEGVGFEVSWDGGRSWSLIGMDYASGDTGNVSWSIPPLPPAEKILLRSFSQGIYGHRAYDANPVALGIKPLSDKALLQEIARRAFLYFQDYQDPVTGLFLDAPGADASTAVTGFGLAAMAIGAEEGWIGAQAAKERVLRTLKTLAQLQQPLSLPDAVLGNVPPSQNGFFYHFMKPGSAKRAGKSEISVVDTAILLMGALAAGEYFGGDVKALAAEIYRGVQWDRFYDADAKAFRMAWTPEKGYFPTHWDYFTDEALLIQVLAAGSRRGEVGRGAYDAMRLNLGRWRDGEKFFMSWTGSLFTYQYFGAWVNTDGYRDARGRDWWENARRAAQSNRDFCWYNEDRPESYGPHRWGISCFHRPVGYTGNFGALPNGSGEAQEDGTLSPIACASSTAWLPFESLNDVKHVLASHPYLLGPYGLRNAYNVKKRWFSNVDFGMDTGLLLLSLENLKNGLLWDALRKNTFVKEGLKRCGIKPAPAPRALPKFPLLLPRAPLNAPAELLNAQDIVQSMENLCLRDDVPALREFMNCADDAYGQALENLEALGENGGPRLRLHRDWLLALIASRQASAARMRRHLGRVLQAAQEIRPADEEDALLLPYAQYSMAADLRDFQEPFMGAMLRDLGRGEAAAKTMEEFARQCQMRGRYAAAVHAWTEALDMRRMGEASAPAWDYTRKIAEGFLDAGRPEDAMRFDRLFLKSFGEAGGKDAVPRVLDLARQYREAGADYFAKECYAAVLALPEERQTDRGEILYQIARLEQAHKNYHKAKEYFEALIKQQPNGAWTQYAQLGVAVNNLFLRNDPESLDTLERFIKDNPDSALRDDVAYNLGMAYYRGKKYDQAKRHLESVSSSNEEIFQAAEDLRLKIKLIK